MTHDISIRSNFVSLCYIFKSKKIPKVADDPLCLRYYSRYYIKRHNTILVCILS